MFKPHPLKGKRGNREDAKGAKMATQEGAMN